MEKNRQTEKKVGKEIWYDYVEKIDYRGYQVAVAEYGEGKEVLFTFLTDLAVNKKNIKKLIEDGRKRWSRVAASLPCRKATQPLKRLPINRKRRI